MSLLIFKPLSVRSELDQLMVIPLWLVHWWIGWVIPVDTEINKDCSETESSEEYYLHGTANALHWVLCFYQGSK